MMGIRHVLTTALGASVAAASAGLVLTALAPAAGASTPPCASSAKIVSRSGSGFVEWAGAETRGALAKFTGRFVTRGNHFYELHNETIKLSFGGDTFALGGSAIFALGCSGLAAGDKAIMPSLHLLRGTAIVHTTHAVEGSVFTEEALTGPVVHSAATSFSVVRSLRQHTPLTMNQRVNWYLGYRNQPAGTTTSKTQTTLRINITPYVGPRHGSCRQVHSATLSTITTFGHGTATYHF